jgi:hypothetical protein
MEGFRSFQAVAVRSLVFAGVAALIVAVFVSGTAALALFLGNAVGVAYLLHIAGTFRRLVKSGRRYLPLLTVGATIRVILVGALPFMVFRHGPALVYFTYLAGFVAALGVAIASYHKQTRADCALKPVDGPSASTSA